MAAAKLFSIGGSASVRDIELFRFTQLGTLAVSITLTGTQCVALGPARWE